MSEARVVFWAVVTAGACLAVLANGLSMCVAALSGRYPVAAFFVAATVGICDWVAAAWRRWRAAVARWAAEQERVS